MNVLAILLVLAVMGGLGYLAFVIAEAMVVRTREWHGTEDNVADEKDLAMLDIVSVVGLVLLIGAAVFAAIYGPEFIQ